MTVGVDLSAQPAGTATATLLWDGEAAEVLDVVVGVTDSDLVARVQDADVVGIDCPFGWPHPSRGSWPRMAPGMFKRRRCLGSCGATRSPIGRPIVTCAR